MTRANATDFDEIGDPMGDDPGLTATGPGQDESWFIITLGQGDYKGG